MSIKLSDYAYQPPKATPTQLSAVDISDVSQGVIAYVISLNNFFEWNPDSTEAPDNINVICPNSITPPAPGRWLITSALSSNFKQVKNIASTTYTVLPEDMGYLLIFNANSNVVVTVAANLSPAPAGFGIRYTGSATLTAIAGSGVTMSEQLISSDVPLLNFVETAANTWFSYGAFVPSYTTYNFQTGTAYTLTNKDNKRIIQASNSSTQTYTIPRASTEIIPVGFSTKIENVGTGTINLVLQGSDTLTGSTSIPPKTSAIIELSVGAYPSGSKWNCWIIPNYIPAQSTGGGFKTVKEISSSSYTVAAADLGSLLVFTNTSDYLVVTIPSGLGTSPIGFGALYTGTITAQFDADGTTINGELIFTKNSGIVSVVSYSTDVWQVTNGTDSNQIQNYLRAMVNGAGGSVSPGTVVYVSNFSSDEKALTVSKYSDLSAQVPAGVATESSSGGIAIKVLQQGAYPNSLGGSTGQKVYVTSAGALSLTPSARWIGIVLGGSWLYINANFAVVSNVSLGTAATKGVTNSTLPTVASVASYLESNFFASDGTGSLVDSGVPIGSIGPAASKEVTDTSTFLPKVVSLNTFATNYLYKADADGNATDSGVRADLVVLKTATPEIPFLKLFSPPSIGVTEGTSTVFSNGQCYPEWRFVQGETKYLYGILSVPKDWDSANNLMYFGPTWYAASGSPGGTVDWIFEAYIVGNAENMNFSGFGTPVTLTTTLGATNFLQVPGFSGPISPGGYSVNDSSRILFRIRRGTSDTLAATANLIWPSIMYEAAV